MNAETTKATSGAANHTAASWFNKDIFYALIAPTLVSRLGFALLLSMHLVLVLLMLKQVSVGGVFFFWCLLSTLVSAGLIRPLIMRFVQAQTLRLQPYFYRHFYSALGLMTAMFVLLPFSVFLSQYQAYNLMSIWLLCVSGALTGVWANHDWRQANAASLVITIIGWLSLLAIWFGVLQSSETVSTLVRGGLPEVVLGCYGLSAILLLSPLISGWMDTKVPVRTSTSQSWLPIRLRLLLSMQLPMFAFLVPLLCIVALFIAYWFDVDVNKAWSPMVGFSIGMPIVGLLPDKWRPVFQANPALLERLAFTLAINPRQAQRQIYQTILTLFFIGTMLIAVLLIIFAILSGELLLLGIFLVTCTLPLWIYMLQYYSSMLGISIMMIVMGAGSVIFFIAYNDPRLLTIAAALYFFTSLGYCYFKPPKSPFGELL
ncbi:hypothetical protein [Motilimonas cestriensis]|uniref:hypothetical protein n=1 Tax=Motilimonas cestriensis TaxID=2742685 RepID=UPI003DA2675F